MKNKSKGDNLACSESLETSYSAKYKNSMQK